MMSILKKINFIPFAIALTLSLFSSHVLAVVTSSQFAHTPPAITNSSNAKPIVMLATGNDHQLFYKAYNDWSDLNGDGTLNTTYTDTFDYYGYFDSSKCYYVSGIDAFLPAADLATGANNHHCDTNSDVAARWSGNFLNWVSMSRMDIMRKVLFGGKRSGLAANATYNDTPVYTILERAYIPNDNHAWSKYFPATDLNKYTPFDSGTYTNGVTFCNVTPYDGTNEYSETTTAAPRLRVANGKWDSWAAQEGVQCMWDGEAPLNRTTAESPANDYIDGFIGEFVGEYYVRVFACFPGRLGTESCQSYDGGTNYKPIGLLNTYGEAGLMDFGLITGTYETGKDGGILRKNISPMTDEINADGTWNTSTNGIISTMNLFRISRYSYEDSGYGNALLDNCSDGQNTWTNTHCANWGNPMGEIYLEALRYFSGASPINTFRANADDTWIPGIAHGLAWRDPYGAAETLPVGGGYPSCSKPNIINFSTGIFGFDHDNYAAQSTVGGTLDVNAETDTVGDTELNPASTYYVGSLTGGSAGDVCSAQTVTSLSAVTGLCPEAAGLQGSFKIAGLSYYSHVNDIRPAITGDQKVNTFSISLAPPIPDIKVEVNGKTVRIIPVGHNWRDSNAMVLVNFQVISQTDTSGEFFMNYENAPAGSDHDSDFKGYLKYDVSGDNISITGYNTGSSAGSTMHMGYVIDGVTDSGIYYVTSNQDVTVNTDAGFGGDYSTTQAAIDTNCGALTLPASGSLVRCSSTLIIDADTTTRDLRGARTHTAGTSTAELLKNPLWYAAKWGGFTDINNDGKPLDVLEYDSVINSTNATGSDGIPDNYVVSQDPAKIESRLNDVLSQISNRRSAGSAAAVITNTVTSTSMVVQGLYQPEIKSLDQLQTVQWGGFLHTLLLDKDLNFREDGDQDGQLDSYTTDKVIRFFYDTSQNRTRVARYNTSDGSTLTLDSIVEIDDVKNLWDAKRELNKMSSAALTANRTYADANNLSTNENSMRYIFTWLDADYDGVVDTGEQTEFLASNFASNQSNIGYFNLQADKDGDSDIDEDDAKQLVNFIRGVDYPGLRNRTIDPDGDGTDEVWRLGDIIHSSPVIVEKPTGIWRTQYGDTTYDEFITQYSKRRSVVYVGANDGLLHAFNSGFFDSANKKYDLTRTAASPHETAAPASHKLGAEIWAYAPKNLLPHLQWLSELNYPNHVYYVDGDLKTFDVNIFPDDTDHPNGWGTILVATMRFGGGSDDGTNPTSLDIDVDGDATADFKARSSIIILDITNPEEPPKLLAEFNDTNLGLTLSTPELIVFRQPNLADGDWSIPSRNDWYLVFGSGPTDLDTLLSRQTPSVYTMKLNDMVTTKRTLATTNSYIGKMHTVDWTNNFITDNVYFGVAGGATVAEPTGYLARMGSAELEDNTNTAYYDIDTNWKVSTVINPSQPFLFKPTTLKISGKNWVYAGSGRRLLSADDLFTPTQSYYGIKEKLSDVNGLPDFTPNNAGDYASFTSGTSAATLTDTEIQNVTGLQIFANYTVLDPLTSLPASPVITIFSQLESYLNSVQGWYRDWDTINSLNERVNADTQTFSQQLLITTFQPSSNSCETSGTTNFYSLYNKTGTAHPGAGFGEDTSVTNAGSNLVTDSTSYDGENFGNVVCIGANCGIVIQGSGDGAADSIKGGSTGGGTVLEGIKTTPGAEGRQSWREIYIEEEF